MAESFKDYAYIERSGKTGYVLRAEAPAVTAALSGPRTNCGGERGGRGSIGRFPLDDGEGVVRGYLRGGLMARLLGDRYLGNRMLREFRVMVDLYNAGASVPQPLGVMWERRGWVYRGALATRSVDGVTLLTYLRANHDVDGVLRTCGQQICAMHDQGVWHADLHVNNILVGEGHVWIIDFDNAHAGDSVSRLGRCRNLLRFRRSLEKHGQSLDNFTTLLAGYGKLGLPRWLSCLYRLRGLGRMPDRKNSVP